MEKVPGGLDGRAGGGCLLRYRANQAQVIGIEEFLVADKEKSPVQKYSAPDSSGLSTEERI